MTIEELTELGFEFEPTANESMTNVKNLRRFRINGRLAFSRSDAYWVQTIEKPSLEETLRFIINVDFPPPDALI